MKRRPGRVGVIDSPAAAHGKRSVLPGAGWYFAFFFLSGYCSLVYEVVWLRLAMARFGVTTPLVSIVLSLFMAGLALGSWFAGRISRVLDGRPGSYFLRLYALSELLIGVSALAVPRGLEWGRALLAGAGASGETADWGSTSYYIASGFSISLILLPFCTCMGATFPLAMSAIRKGHDPLAEKSFSYLYLANVLGACAGTLTSAFVLIEVFGFRRTLDTTAALNALVAAAAFWLSTSPAAIEPKASRPLARRADPDRRQPLSAFGTAIPLLFLTGLISLAMEVVWIRQLTPYLGPVVYAFAGILTVYLASTALGSTVYRRWSPRKPASGGALAAPALLAIGVGALLSLLAADPRLARRTVITSDAARLILGLAPFCGVVGFLTPLLVDRWARGDPDRAGRAYAVNVIGCILGPLLAGFCLLPAFGERGTLLVLAVPLVGFGLLAAVRGGITAGRPARFGLKRSSGLAGVVGLSGLLVFGTRDYESDFPSSEIRRDYTATIIAEGEGMKKQLLVNGQGITSLTPITKMMAHLPMASLASPPRNVLVICFGMGTSFRSALSWGTPTTAVELVPSVPSLFGFFHADGPLLLRSPEARVVIDDGRRFLERTRERYDVITIDPPPPVEAAASGLLYSRDFYSVIRTRMAPGGILQQWLPSGERIVVSAVARALRESFPSVRVFRSVEGWGFHFLASDRTIPSLPASALAARLPARAAADLLEWGPHDNPEAQFQAVVGSELSLADLIALDPEAPALQDDRPVNEYYFLRRTFARSQPPR